MAEESIELKIHPDKSVMKYLQPVSLLLIYFSFFNSN